MNEHLPPIKNSTGIPLTSDAPPKGPAEIMDIGMVRLKALKLADSGVAPLLAQEAKKQADALARAVIEDGKTLRQAARSLGTSLAELERDPRVLANFARTIADYSLEAKDRKAYVKAKLTQIAETAEAPRDQVAALKVLAADPELGLTGHGPQVQVNVGDEVKAVLANIDIDAD